MIPKSLTSSSSDWDVLKLRNSDHSLNKENAYSRKILPGAKRKQSNINEFLLAVGSKLSDRNGNYAELTFKPTSSSTPKPAVAGLRDSRAWEISRSNEYYLRNKSKTFQQRQLEFPKRRSLSTGNLPTLSPQKSEALNVLDQILQHQETLTIKRYLLNNCWVKVLVLEDTEL